MKLSYDEVVHLKNVLVKAQRFEEALKFREEEKRLWNGLSKKAKQQITELKNSSKEKLQNEFAWATVKLSLPLISKSLSDLGRIAKRQAVIQVNKSYDINWKMTGNDPYDLFAKPKRNHMLRVERLDRSVYWWAFYIGKSDFASYDVGDYGKSLEDAKEKCELYYYLHVTK